MEIRHAEAFGHDLHGLLGAADLRAVFEHELPGLGDQFQHSLGFVHSAFPPLARRFSAANQTAAATADTALTAAPTPAPGW